MQYYDPSYIADAIKLQNMSRNQLFPDNNRSDSKTASSSSWGGSPTIFLTRNTCLNSKYWFSCAGTYPRLLQHL